MSAKDLSQHDEAALFLVSSKIAWPDRSLLELQVYLKGTKAFDVLFLHWARQWVAKGITGQGQACLLCCRHLTSTLICFVEKLRASLSNEL